MKVQLKRLSYTGGHQEDLSATGHARQPACWGTVHSGLPPRTPLFNGTVCRGNTAFSQHNGALCKLLIWLLSKQACNVRSCPQR